MPSTGESTRYSYKLTMLTLLRSEKIGTSDRPKLCWCFSTVGTKKLDHNLFLDVNGVRPSQHRQAHFLATDGAANRTMMVLLFGRPFGMVRDFWRSDEFRPSD